MSLWLSLGAQAHGRHAGGGVRAAAEGGGRSHRNIHRNKNTDHDHNCSDASANAEGTCSPIALFHLLSPACLHEAHDIVAGRPQSPCHQVARSATGNSIANVVSLGLLNCPGFLGDLDAIIGFVYAV